MSKTTLLQVGIILLIGVVSGWWVLSTDPMQISTGEPTSATQNSSATTDSGGTHGGRLFSKGDLNLELVLYEKNTLPRFRAYPMDRNNLPIAPADIQIQMKLERLDRVDIIHFQPEPKFLLGVEVVEEPHSFIMKIQADWKGQSYLWEYSHFEGRARINEQEADNAGIQTAVAGPKTLKNVILLNGEIALHEKKVTHVVPRVDAMVIQVKKDLGDWVKKGEVLAILESRTLADVKNTYLKALKNAEPVQLDYKREQTIYNNTLTMLELLNRKMSLDDLYTEINQMILGDSRATVVPAYATLIRTQAVYEREQSLYEKKISSRAEYLLAMEEYKSAEARYLALREKVRYDGELTLLKKKQAYEMARLNVEAVAQKLITLGLARDEIRQLSTDSQHRFTRYELRSEVDGEVIQKHIAGGEAVKKDDDIFVLADLSEIWVNLAIPEQYLDFVKLGQAIKVKAENLKLEASGRLSYIGAIIDEKTRTVTGRIVLPNPGRKWRPGMYVTAELTRDERTLSVAVPVEAVQTLRNWSVVFIKKGDIYEARPLTLGQSDGKWVEVIKGLNPGDTYVAKNSFAVKAEIGKALAAHP